MTLRETMRHHCDGQRSSNDSNFFKTFKRVSPRYHVGQWPRISSRPWKRLASPILCMVFHEMLEATDATVIAVKCDVLATSSTCQHRLVASKKYHRATPTTCYYCVKVYPVSMREASIRRSRFCSRRC
jgi:hypothetical protein